MGFNIIEQELEDIPYSPYNTFSHASIGFGLFSSLLCVIYFFKLAGPEVLSLGPCVLCFVVGMFAALMAIGKRERMRWIGLMANMLPVCIGISSQFL